jgi:hypothetical protein
MDSKTLVIWNVRGLNSRALSHYLTLRLVGPSNPTLCWLTIVYGPHQDQGKLDFMREIRNTRSHLQRF